MPLVIENWLSAKSGAQASRLPFIRQM